MILKGGYKTLDKRLDRVPQFDPRSRSYPIRQTVENRIPRSYTWRINGQLDQGSEGACVGFAWAHELIARPLEIVASDQVARGIYKDAQKIDEWPGEEYEGTSVIAGAKVVQSMGVMGEYRWCFSLEDVILAVGFKGPVVVGTYWYSGMFEPTNGYLKPEGYVAGGHAWVIYSVNLKRQEFIMKNSWGSDWGNNGTAKISFTDFAKLLHEDGEACVPVKRIKGSI